MADEVGSPASGGHWACSHCAALKPPHQSSIDESVSLRAVCRLCGSVSEPLSAADAAAAAAEPSATPRPLDWQTESAKLMQRLGIPDWAAERLLAVRGAPEFCGFSEADLALAIESCGGLAYEDAVLLRRLGSRCSNCRDQVPRDRLVVMATCDCELCWGCFHRFLWTADSGGGARNCPVCHVPCAKEPEMRRQLLLAAAPIIGAEAADRALGEMEPDRPANLLQRRLLSGYHSGGSASFTSPRLSQNLQRPLHPVLAGTSSHRDNDMQFSDIYGLTFRPSSTEEDALYAIMGEFGLRLMTQAVHFRSLRAEPEFRDCDPLDLGEAVRSCGDRPDYVDFVSAYFKNDCQICLDAFPRHRLLQMASCQCKLCFRCFRNFVSTSLDNNDHVSHLQCPICNTPDSENVKQLESHFELLMIQVTSFQHPEIRFDAEKIGVLEQRLRDWNLMRNPNFRWCSHCPNGVELSARMLGQKFRCDQCSGHTCRDCRKQWQDQHGGISCEQFQRWLTENDPEFQEKGVAAFLQSSGIECPKCRFKYALAKGGCMHFTCRQCRAEFCSGCGGFFNRVKGRGLVCEHPRDCLFYLRDFSLQSLQKLLTDHGIQHEAAAGGAASGTCGVMEQKETGSGSLVDEACGRPVEGHASLCRKHFTEYLVSLINRNRLDPVEVMDADQLRKLCATHEIHYASNLAEDAEALRLLVIENQPMK